MLVLQSEGPKFKSSHDHLLDLFLVKKVHVQPSWHTLFWKIPNWFAPVQLRFLFAVFTFEPPMRRKVNRPTDWRILKIVLAQFRVGSITRVTAEIEPKFRIQSEICGSGNGSGLQLHLFFGPGFWTLCTEKIFRLYFGFWEILTADLLNKLQRIGGSSFPIHLPH